MTKITIEQIKKLSKATVELEAVLKEIGLELDCGDGEPTQAPPKFKVGDEVVLPNGKFGKILTISGIVGSEMALVSSDGYPNASYKLTDLKMKPATPAPKFKVGDEVEISANRFGKILAIVGEAATVDIDNEATHGSFRLADLKLKMK